LGQKKDPHQTLERLERWSGRATLWILFGIFVEIGSVIWFPHDHWERFWAVVANAAIGIGLIVEYVVIGRAIVATREAEAESNQKVAEAEARASEANQKAQEAALELAKFRSPRTFTRDQMYRVAEMVKPYAGMQFAGATTGRDPEYLGFLQFIEMALKLADWQEIDWHTSPGVTRSVGRTTIGTTVSVSNVLVTFPLRGSGSQLEDAAIKLTEALTQEGFVAQAGVAHGSDSLVIQVMVGPKT
jgi:hypothetical protein